MRYEVMTSLTPEEVIEDALAYFGPGSTGLEVTSQTAQGVVLQGGGGYVAIQVQPGTHTTVAIETREWDYPVHQLASITGSATLGHPRLLPNAFVSYKII